jgi:hypothetical protein
MECPSGNYNDEALRIREKARGLGHCIATASLRPHEALLVKNSRVEPAVGYSLPVGAMSEEQAHKAQGVVVKYITSLRTYLLISGMGLHIKAIQPPVIKREHDEVLMDRASKMDRKQMTDKFIERVNRCRNFMRVETIADITTSDGKYICKHAFECNPEVRTRSKKLWPNQPHVGIFHVKSWQWYLKLWCKDGSLELRQQLGKWTVEPTDRGWAAYYIEAIDTVMTRDRGNWREHKVHDKQRAEWNLCDYHATRTGMEVMSIVEKIPLEGWLDNDGFVGVCKPLGSGSDWKDNAATASNAKDWDEYKRTLPECVREVLKGCIEVEKRGQTRSYGNFAIGNKSFEYLQ